VDMRGKYIYGCLFLGVGLVLGSGEVFLRVG